MDRKTWVDSPWSQLLSFNVINVPMHLVKIWWTGYIWNDHTVSIKSLQNRVAYCVTWKILQTNTFLQTYNYFYQTRYTVYIQFSFYLHNLSDDTNLIFIHLQHNLPECDLWKMLVEWFVVDDIMPYPQNMCSLLVKNPNPQLSLSAINIVTFCTTAVF